MRDISVTISDALDAALEMTFPASDPIAVFIRDDDAWDGATAHGWRPPTARVEHDDERPA